MKLLFITQKLHQQDVFAQLWAAEFARIGYDVHVLCLEDRISGQAHLPFAVSSMGKEKGNSKLSQIWNFWKFIVTLKYDRVFIHMSPVWGVLGARYWILKRMPVYLWYTHYKMQLGVRMLGWYGKRFFCATPQSLPQYEGNPKKIVTGHGIDLAAWPQKENICDDPHRLIAVHRLSRSKRLEICIRALTILPGQYTLDIYGIEAESDYVAELKALVEELGLQDRAQFHGTIPMNELHDIYSKHRLILNMASETIDKTMLEAMTCGCYPVTTKANAEAIGISHAVEEDTPEALAAFVEMHKDQVPMDADSMYRVVAEQHSLEALVKKMDSYMRDGN